MSRCFFSSAKKLIFLIGLLGFGMVHAGSYDDFFQAAKQDNPENINALLSRGFDANTVDPQGRHAIFIALGEGSYKAAQVLIDWPKTDINQLNSQDESALMLVALKGRLDMAEDLIKRGADINKTGWAPLHYAASSGSLAIISLLLDNNAYIDAESPNGTTPLMMAAMYGTADAVNLLLQEGADPNLKNQKGLTALQFAQRGNRPDSVEAIAAAMRKSRPTGKW